MESVYTASRIFGGRVLYPQELHFLGDKVVLVQRGLFKTSERTIPLSKIASVSVTLGIATGSVRVESSGGTEDIVATGFKKSDIQRFRVQVESAIR